MNKTRLEAFSDGVIAIIITIMVLEIKVPHDGSWDGVINLRWVFLSYILSFVSLGIYWVNHHHLIHAIKKVQGTILWANLCLLFWLSLMPFVTAWMGESHFAKNAVIAYALLSNFCGVSYFFLLLTIKNTHLNQPDVMNLLKYQTSKGGLSAISYLISFIIAFFYPMVSVIIFLVIALIWIIPDKNIERALSNNS
ncbi:MAG: TMEM175 family protein [Saprospiraceae bacterium]